MLKYYSRRQKLSKVDTENLGIALEWVATSLYLHDSLVRPVVIPQFPNPIILISVEITVKTNILMLITWTYLKIEKKHENLNDWKWRSSDVKNRTMIPPPSLPQCDERMEYNRKGKWNIILRKTQYNRSSCCSINDIKDQCESNWIEYKSGNCINNLKSFRIIIKT